MMSNNVGLPPKGKACDRKVFGSKVHSADQWLLRLKGLVPARYEDATGAALSAIATSSRD